MDDNKNTQIGIYLRKILQAKNSIKEFAGSKGVSLDNIPFTDYAKELQKIKTTQQIEFYQCASVQGGVDATDGSFLVSNAQQKSQQQDIWSYDSQISEIFNGIWNLTDNTTNARVWSKTVGNDIWYIKQEYSPTDEMFGIPPFYYYVYQGGTSRSQMDEGVSSAATVQTFNSIQFYYQPNLQQQVYVQVKAEFSEISGNSTPTWSGYKMTFGVGEGEVDGVVGSEAGWVKSQTLTTGLSIVGYTPQIGKVYAVDTTVSVDGMYPQTITQVDLTNLTAQNIKYGVMINGVVGSYTSGGTANSVDLLLDKTAFVNGSMISGSISTYDGITSVNPSNSSQTLSTAGKYLDSDIIVNVASELEFYQCGELEYQQFDGDFLLVVVRGYMEYDTTGQGNGLYAPISNTQAVRLDGKYKLNIVERTSYDNQQGYAISVKRLQNGQLQEEEICKSVFIGDNDTFVEFQSIYIQSNNGGDIPLGFIFKCPITDCIKITGSTHTEINTVYGFMSDGFEGDGSSLAFWINHDGSVFIADDSGEEDLSDLPFSSKNLCKICVDSYNDIVYYSKYPLSDNIKQSVFYDYITDEEATDINISDATSSDISFANPSVIGWSGYKMEKQAIKDINITSGSVILNEYDACQSFIGIYKKIEPNKYYCEYVGKGNDGYDNYTYYSSDMYLIQKNIVEDNEEYGTGNFWFLIPSKYIENKNPEIQAIFYAVVVDDLVDTDWQDGMKFMSDQYWVNYYPKMSVVDTEKWRWEKSDIVVNNLQINGYTPQIGKVYTVDTMISIDGMYPQTIDQADLTKLTPQNIKYGVTINGITGSYTSGGTANSMDLLLGKTAFVNGSMISGSISTYIGNTSIVPTTSQQILQTSGKYVESNITIQAADILDTSDANASNLDMLLNKTAYVNGSKISGSISTYDGITSVNPSNSSQTLSTAGKYLDSDIIVNAATDVGLQESNVLVGVKGWFFTYTGYVISWYEAAFYDTLQGVFVQESSDRYVCTNFKRLASSVVPSADILATIVSNGGSYIEKWVVEKVTYNSEQQVYESVTVPAGDYWVIHCGDTAPESLSDVLFYYSASGTATPADVGTGWLKTTGTQYTSFEAPKFEMRSQSSLQVFESPVSGASNVIITAQYVDESDIVYTLSFAPRVIDDNGTDRKWFSSNRDSDVLELSYVGGKWIIYSEIFGGYLTDLGTSTDPWTCDWKKAMEDSGYTYLGMKLTII